jgi:uncharacterized protein with PIN domain
LAFRDDQSLRHLAEALGLPACEIGCAIADGRRQSLEKPPPDGSLVELFPVEEPVALRDMPRFIADVHVGRLSRDLRLLGFDVLWRNDYEDRAIVDASLSEGRIVLTRDRGLLFRRAFKAELEESEKRAVAMLVRSRDPYVQLVQVFRRFGLAALAKPFSLCSACGGALEPATREAVSAIVPEVVAERYSAFFLCGVCGKAFWPGDHLRTIEPFLERLGSDLGEKLDMPRE